MRQPLPFCGLYFTAHLIELFHHRIAVDQLMQLLTHTPLQEELLELKRFYLNV